MHDLTGKALYLAVRCETNFRHIIPLKVIEFEVDGITGETWGDSPPFDATCDICKSSQQYRGHEVIVWLGPLPSENFRTHPAFRALDPDPQ
jgi:hypothetical protein